MNPFTAATAVLLLVYTNCPDESIEKTFARLDPFAISFVPSDDRAVIDPIY